ncbi:MAG: tetratricopeptide repeat protein [Rhodothermales bacterium]|nr:tetratricopeptide repeat protein [Rhodothermales bacterium]
MDSKTDVNTDPDLESEEPEAISLFGTPLYRSIPSAEADARMQSQLAEAIELREADPEAVDGFVWHGRRLAYLGHYNDAIQVYTDGLEQHADEPHLLRHRAHRYITLRRFDEAISDFEKAAEAVEDQPDEIEPDGQPNAAGVPLSTLKTNIWYHLGLAHYLTGDFDKASESFQTCFDLSENDDMRVAAADWLYMSLRRSGKLEEANEAIAFVAEGMNLLENQTYYDRLLMYRGLTHPDSLSARLHGDDEALALATLGYGVGNWQLMNGDTLAATTTYRRVIETGIWAAFGYIAAEADLVRLETVN